MHSLINPMIPIRARRPSTIKKMCHQNHQVHDWHEKSRSVLTLSGNDSLVSLARATSRPVSGWPGSIQTPLVSTNMNCFPTFSTSSGKILSHILLPVKWVHVFRVLSDYYMVCWWWTHNIIKIIAKIFASLVIDTHVVLFARIHDVIFKRVNLVGRIVGCIVPQC